MTKKTLVFIILGFLAFPFKYVSAQLEYYAPGAPRVGTLSDLIHAAENVTGLVFGAIAVICFVIAGILFLTAQGQPEKIKTARSAFIWGVGGVIVGIIAFSIIALVSGFIA